ncbi:MAG: energy transducer TonB [Saprospiraceae bacterium]|jgi:outer membrane biosynthesis protein TonB|nr:energy transducer TonB [Saprospiraceae bacterium]
MNKQTTDDARFLELLERWLNGAFDRADERELHALSEKDAFRREAWEGFSALPEAEHEANLARIRRRLQDKNHRRRVPLGAWMAAAAALTLVVAALWFWADTTPVSETAPVAQSVEKTSVETSDTGPSANDLATAAPAPESSASGPAPAGAVARPPRTESAENTPRPETEILADVLNEAADQSEAPAKAEQGAGLARPEAKSVQQEADAVALPPAAAPVFERAAAGETAKPAVAEPTALPRKKADSALQDIARTTGGALPAEPAGGWDNFREYLRRNARLPEAARNNNVSGSVRLQFTVGSDGKPDNLKFLQKLGYGCEEVAERLVRQFDWAPPGNTPVLVEVPFRR